MVIVGYMCVQSFIFFIYLYSPIYIANTACTYNQANTKKARRAEATAAKASADSDDDMIEVNIWGKYV